MTAKPYLSKLQQRETTTTQWPEFLATETERVIETGVHAAILRIALGTEEPRVHDQAANLLRRKLDPTSSFSSHRDGTFTALVVPLLGFVELQARVTRLHTMFSQLRCSPTIGFALRREDESLLDTMARADASVDRELFRREDSGSLLVLPE